METLMLPFSPRFIVLTICAVVTALLLGIGIIDHKVLGLVVIPIVIFGALTAIYARENGQGMAFPVESAGGEAQDSGADAELADETEAPAAPRAVETSAADAAAKAETATDGPQPDDDGSKGGGRARLKIVK